MPGRPAEIGRLTNTGHRRVAKRMELGERVDAIVVLHFLFLSWAAGFGPVWFGFLVDWVDWELRRLISRMTDGFWAGVWIDLLSM